MYRLLDIFISIIAIIIFLPIIILLIILTYIQDFEQPIFVSKRIGKNFKEFNLLKIRTMKINNDQNKIRTTRDDDPRITSIGKYIRRYKLDEVLQFINIFKNEMTIVGPRPNVIEEIKKYNNYELKLLSVKPGLTDLASVALVNMGIHLQNKKNSSGDVNLDYYQKIKPLKNELAMIWVKNKSLGLYCLIILLTVICLINSKCSNMIIQKICLKYNKKLLKKVKLLY